MSDLMKLQNGSDVRGIAVEGVQDEPVNLTPAVANRIGKAFVEWLSKKTGKACNTLKVGIGRDSRISGPSLEEAAVAGMKTAGAKVVRCGLATTPSMFMSVVFEQTAFDGSVMITASHLPYNRNGLKFFDCDGGLEHDDITDILKIACGKEESNTDISGIEEFNLLELYAAHLRSSICKGLGACQEDAPLKGLRITVDAGNGAGGFFANEILAKLGADITGSQFLEPDGMFPNHIPNPENKQAMEAIKKAVLANKSDLGLIFDTDVDRMSAVFANGEEVNRDAIIAMIAAILAPENPESTIITDSVTSDRLTYFLEEVLGLKHLCYMRGYKNVINKQKELNAAGINAPLAMETSGHGALKENYYLDDGAYLAVKMVIALAKAKKNGQRLDSLIEKLPPLVEEGEYRFKILVENFKDYGLKVLEDFKLRAQSAGYKLPQSFEGVRISFDGDAKGWMLLRLSLHDPVMPLNIEGSRTGDVEKIKVIAKQLLAGFDKLDMNCLD